MTELHQRRLPSSHYRDRVEAARERQASRFSDTPGVLTNAQMTPKQLATHCTLNARSQKLLKQAVDKFGLSARAHDRILKLSRTRADLEGRPDISEQDLSFAIGCRVIDRRSWLGSLGAETRPATPMKFSADEAPAE